MKRLQLFFSLFIILSVTALAIDVNYCANGDRKLDIILDIEGNGLLFKSKGSSGTVPELKKTRGSLIINRKGDVYQGYRNKFGETKYFKIKGVDGKKTKILAYKYPDTAAPFIGSDNKGNIWRVDSKKDYRVIGVFAYKNVTDPTGKKRTIRLHKLKDSEKWLCNLDGTLCTEKEGKLQPIGYISWFNYFESAQSFALPMARKMDYPAEWYGRLNNQTIKKPSGPFKELVHNAIKKNRLYELQKIISHNKGIIKELDNEKDKPLLMTVLSSPSADKRYQLVEYLIKMGCDVNRPDKHGDYPINRVADLNNYSLMKLLLDHGADPNQKNSNLTTPLHHASEGRLYLTGGAKLKRSAYIGIVKMLLKRGADVKAKDKWGRTPLHNAAQYLQMYVAEELLKAGADPNSQDNIGDTSGIKAVKGWKSPGKNNKYIYHYRNYDMIRLLDHYGCNYRIKNKKGETYASLYFSDKYADNDLIPKRLKSKRASLAKYSDFNSMSSFVKNSSYEDMIRMFGQPHQFREKDCYIKNRVVSCHVFWYWSDKRYYKFWFKKLVRRVTPRNMTLNIAGYNKPGGTNVTIPNRSAGTVKLTGGELIKFKGPHKKGTPPSMTAGLKTEFLRIFESGKGDLPPEKRNYTDTFDSKKARYINWHIYFKHPALKRDKTFVLNVSFYRENKHYISGFQTTGLKKEWPDSYHIYGWGKATPGFWVKGNYTIVISAGGKKLAEKNFKVI